MKLSNNLAQTIVNEMMRVIPYNVNVMNKEGVIIGSGERNRIGTLHEGAIEAIAKKQMIEIHKSGKGTKHGVNEPILIDGEVIGVVGITGPPEEVRPFSQLVRITTTLLIKQAEYLKEHQEKEKRLEEFLYELAYGKKEYNQNFYYLAKEYGIDLKQNYQGVLLQVQKKENFEEKLKKMLPKSTHFLRLDAHRIILFLRESKENALLFQVLQAKKEVQKIGIGDFSKPFSISIERAAQAIEIGKKIKPNQKIYSYEEWEFFIGLTHSDKTKRIQWIERLEKVGEKLELVRTLQTYIEENGEMNETAKKLNIHRNTLNYRLEKIYKLTGKHPKNLLNLLELLASILWK